MPPLVEIGLIDLPKSRWAIAHPAPICPTSQALMITAYFEEKLRFAKVKSKMIPFQGFDVLIRSHFNSFQFFLQFDASAILLLLN